MRFKKTKFRDTMDARLEELASQTDDLRKQVVERAPGVRDQLLASLPDKGQLLDLRDDLFERLPETVTDRLPEKVKPKRGRLKKVAAIGAVTGAGAAVFAILRRKGTAPVPAVPFPKPAQPAPAPPTAKHVVDPASKVAEQPAKNPTTKATQKAPSKPTTRFGPKT